MGSTELRREGRESSHRLFHMLTSFLRKQGEEQLALMSCCLETKNPEVNVWIVNKGWRNPCSSNWKCTRDGYVVISFFRIESNTEGNFQICWAVFVCIILAVIWYRTVTIYEMLLSLFFFFSGSEYIAVEILPWQAQLDNLENCSIQFILMLIVLLKYSM